MNTKQSQELEERFLQFGVSVIKHVRQLKNELPYSVIDQVIRASTSVGANYSEAQNAISRADFKNKIYIAKKEASEARYWLRIIKELSNQVEIDPLLDEAQQILLILQKIVNTLREKSAS